MCASETKQESGSKIDRLLKAIERLTAELAFQRQLAKPPWPTTTKEWSTS